MNRLALAEAEMLELEREAMAAYVAVLEIEEAGGGGLWGVDNVADVVETVEAHRAFPCRDWWRDDPREAV